MTKKQLGELITDSQESLYRIAKTILASDADCADAVSETIVRAFSCLGTLNDVTIFADKDGIYRCLKCGYNGNYENLMEQYARFRSKYKLMKTRLTLEEQRRM